MEQFPPAEHPSLNHRLVEQLPRFGDWSRFRFVDDKGKVVVERTLGELVTRARRIGAALERKHGLGRGDRVILAYLPSLDFVESFLACLLTGIVPVALMPPDPFGSDIDHLRHVIANSKAKAVLSHRTYHRARMFGRLGRAARLRKPVDWPSIPWVITDAVRGRAQAEIYLPEPDELAFLQYTSGSTGEPRGVRVTHGNVAHNQTYNCKYARLDEQGSLVIWVPHYHDFGLNCGILGTLWTHAQLTLVSPMSFLRRPALWPELMDRYRATATAAPNFALELTRRKTTPEQRASWDLSNLHLLGLGGEAVQAEYVDRFAEAFVAAKLDPTAIGNCYGLAEHVVDVMGPGYDRIRVDPRALLGGELRLTDAADAREIFDAGPPTDYVRIRIVEPETRAVLPDGQIGEIWVCSPGKADGYEGLDSRETFEAQLVPDDGFRYLRTGDLGATLAGRLYVTGRMKELIIVRGHNLIPTDIETALLDVDPDVRPGRVAAFGVDDGAGTEQVVIFAELGEGTSEDRYPQICATIRSTVTSTVPGGTVGTIVLGSRGLVSKTSSGKIQRGVAQRDFLSLDFDARPQVLYVDARETEQPEVETINVEARADQSIRGLVTDALGDVLGVPVDRKLLERSPREMGLDSTQVVELQVALEGELELELDPKLILAASSFEEVLAQLGVDSGDQDQRPRAHAERWRSRPEPPVTASATPPSWRVLGPDPAGLVEQLRAAGHRAAIHEPSSSTEPDACVLIDCTDAESDILGAIERCRGLAQELARSSSPPRVCVVTRAAVACDSAEIASSGAAAVRGFCRSVRAAMLNQGWRLRDLGPSALEHDWTDIAWLGDDETLELARRGDRVLSSTLEVISTELDEHGEGDDALPYGGAALVVGTVSAASLRTASWLARTRGIERLVTLLAGPSDEPPFLDELRAAGLEVTHIAGTLADTDARARLVAALGETTPSWVVLVAGHGHSGEPSRQTRGRVEAAFAAGWTSLEHLAEFELLRRSKDCQLLVLSDLGPWFGPPTRASWVASATAMQATLHRLAHEGWRATHIGAGPIEGWIPARELAKFWRPAGIAPLRGADDLPLLDQALTAGSTSVGIWTPLAPPTQAKQKP